MPLTRFRQAVLLGLALLLVLPAAHARKDDDDRGRNDRRGQQYEQRRADDGRYRQQREDRREQRAPEMRRDEQRGEPAYSEPRRRYEAPQRYQEAPPRRYQEVPRRYEEADTPRSRDYSESRPRSAPPGLSMSEAVMEAQRRSGGRVLSAEPGNDGGQPYYRIKVLNPNGRVQVYYIDAQ